MSKLTERQEDKLSGGMLCPLLATERKARPGSQKPAKKFKCNTTKARMFMKTNGRKTQCPKVGGHLRRNLHNFPTNRHVFAGFCRNRWLYGRLSSAGKWNFRFEMSEIPPVGLGIVPGARCGQFARTGRGLSVRHREDMGKDSLILEGRKRRLLCLPSCIAGGVPDHFLAGQI